MTADQYSVPRLHDPRDTSFASDNYAGVHPAVLEAIAVANEGHQVSYGGDAYTERLQSVMAEHFGAQAQTFPVFSGTGANVLALQAMIRRWEAVVCAESAHIHADEGGAPEKMGGLKLLTVPSPDGKLTPDRIDQQAWGFGFEHRAQPAAVSITQSTELGSCYTPDEIAAVAEHAHALGLTVHLDGARIANAAAHLDVPLRAFTTDAGVDVVSLGGTKNGLLAAEAVVVLNPDAVSGMVYLRKTTMQLASKMRFFSAQLLAMYGTDLWLDNARHANAMALRLAESVRGVPGVEVTQPVQANAVFAALPRDATARLQKRYRFYTWDEQTSQVRWMCAFDTTGAAVDAFAAAVAEEVAR